MQKNNTVRGHDGENRAALFLENKGMAIIARNIRSKTGEIDLVVQDHDTVVFVEVKNWSVYEFEDLQYSINWKKQQRIIETAQNFLAAHHEYATWSSRFDVIFIGAGTINHIVSAFSDEERYGDN
ncbi:UPF0102 protein [Spirochaetia bacterium]|nr:UPF0102 protein [Spirochaetia bacterium]